MNISDSQESDNNTSSESCSYNACELCGIIKFRNKHEKLKIRNKWGECMNAELSKYMITESCSISMFI